jgi:RNA polymerase sigma-70 factor (ECF subfamily)
MHALEGHDYSHIAATLKIPSGTVGTRLLRARRKLRELLLAENGRSEP